VWVLKISSFRQKSIKTVKWRQISGVALESCWMYFVLKLTFGKIQKEELSDSLALRGAIKNEEKLFILIKIRTL